MGEEKRPTGCYEQLDIFDSHMLYGLSPVKSYGIFAYNIYCRPIIK